MIVTPNRIAELIVEIITGRRHRYPKAVHVSSNPRSELSVYDLSFPLEIQHWRGYVETDTAFLKSFKSILEYCMVKLLNDTTGQKENNQVYVSELRRYIVNKCCENGEVELGYFISILSFCVHQNIVQITYPRERYAVEAIRAVYKQDSNFGIKENSKTRVKLDIEYADESDVTNLRLDLLKKVTSNFLKSQGFDVQDEECHHNYIFTIKSEGKVIDNYQKYVCGVVLNCNKHKERQLTVASYIQNKIDKVKELNEQRHSGEYIDRNNIQEDIKKIANAAISHEMLSVKHMNTVTLESLDNIDKSIKEGSFILYNCVRMNAILQKYAKSVLEKEMPEVPEIDNFDYFTKLNHEEWALIYNFMIKYPDVLSATISMEPKLDVNIQLFWSFVSSLCHEFSKYYRRNRILLKNSNYNRQISEIASERIHILRALRIIIRNSLTLLEIQEVNYM